MEANNNALVIFSGGQDSTTCLFWAIRNFDKVWALTFSYGQKHVSEVEAAERIAREAGGCAYDRNIGKKFAYQRRYYYG